MAPPELRIPSEVAVLIRGLHPDLKKGVRRALEAILAEPAIGKSLKDELSGLSSYRIKRFRIIYRRGPGQLIEIIAIGPRRYIYEETFKIMSKEKKK
jgi:mRNA interferase RelE/StbE